MNKVCASGMKAVCYASQSIALGHADVVVAGAPPSGGGRGLMGVGLRRVARVVSGAPVDGWAAERDREGKTRMGRRVAPILLLAAGPKGRAKGPGP